MKVLLFANIGTDRNGYYHVGDEAMFCSAYYFYRQHFPGYKLSALVSAPIYKNHKVEEIIGLTWPPSLWSARLYYAKLVFKTVLWCKCNISLFSPEQKRLLETIQSQDLIHFVGGGYLTTECGGWLYYPLLVLEMASQLKVRTIMTSQTIGPFDNIFDRALAARVINKSEFVMLRTKSNRQKLALRKLGVTEPTITTTLDRAYFLPRILPEKTLAPKSQNTLRIGLSLHQIKGKNEVLKQIIATLLRSLGGKQRIELLLLPHILHKQLPWDLEFMDSIVADLGSSIKILRPNYYALGSLSKLSQIIKGLTSTCDIVITTRYHGVVFALSESVPCLAIVGNTYQYMKNSEALRFVFGSRAKDYLLDLRARSARVGALTTLRAVLADKTPLRKHIRSQNLSLHKGYVRYLSRLKKVVRGRPL